MSAPFIIAFAAPIVFTAIAMFNAYRRPREEG
jgi:hypothetical protein